MQGHIRVAGVPRAISRGVCGTRCPRSDPSVRIKLASPSLAHFRRPTMTVASSVHTAFIRPGWNNSREIWFLRAGITVP